jgi:signal transduction histidine kinase
LGSKRDLASADLGVTVAQRRRGPMSRPNTLVAADTAPILNDAIDCIGDGIALYGADDALVFANRAYRDMHAAIKDLIAPGARFEALVRAGLDSGDGAPAAPAEAEIEDRLARHLRADGVPTVEMRGRKWLMSTERRMADGGVVVIETDITELKKAEIARYEFLAKVSHELRTPLTPIHGALSLMKSGKVAHLSGKLEDLVDLASRNCTRLMAIANDLLDFTRIGAGRFSINATTVELQPFLEQVVETRRIAPDAPAIEMNVSPGAKGAKLVADPLRIQQVLDNLLANAIKFTPEGGGIEVDVDRHDGHLRISVADHGPGIPKDFRRQVFEVFTQADSSCARGKGGSGLGLSICKSIVEAHGGRIGFISEAGEGTTFYFDLPLAKHEQKGSSAAKPPSKASRQRRGVPAASGQRL